MTLTASHNYNYPFTINCEGGFCMLGGIYTDEKCPLCGELLKDNNKNALCCKNHPEYRAVKLRVKFKGVSRRFKEYEKASRFLNGLRFKYDENDFDERDYRKDRPLGFENLSSQWLKLKEKEIERSTFRSLSNHIYTASKQWNNTNIKDIGYKEIQIFINSLEGLADKTKYNYLGSIKQFFKWCEKAERGFKEPDYPEVKYELGWRNTIDKETQQKIIDEVYNIIKDYNIRIWIGIKWLSTYFNVRPKEILNIKEGHINIRTGEILIPHPKEKRPKLIYLIDEDIEIIKSLPRGMPNLYFFRHRKGIKGVKSDKRFGDHLFYTTWKKACNNLEIDNVDLYGGTRHSTVRALRRYRTPEEIKLASMHTTNKAFERYYRVEGDDLRSIYKDTKSGQKLAKKSIDKK